MYYVICSSICNSTGCCNLTLFQNLLYWIISLNALHCWFWLVASLLSELVRSCHRLKLLWYKILTQGVLSYRTASSSFCSLQIVPQKFTLEGRREFSWLSGGCLSKFLEAKKRDSRSLFFDSFNECIQSSVLNNLFN